MRGVFRLEVEVPSGTTAAVWVPSNGRMAHVTPDGAAFDRVANDRAVYRMPPGIYVFTVRDEPGQPRP